MKDYSKLIKEFYEDVISYYSLDNGTIPIATNERIIKVCNEYLESKPLSEIWFDSMDRIFVRRRLDKGYSSSVTAV